MATEPGRLPFANGRVDTFDPSDFHERYEANSQDRDKDCADARMRGLLRKMALNVLESFILALF